jgi:hypothetical protein
MTGLFLKTGGDTPVILESAEHALNDMAFFVLEQNHPDQQNA